MTRATVTGPRLITAAAVLAVTLLTLAPGAWNVALAQTGGPATVTCPAGTIQQADGGCTTESKATIPTTQGTQQANLGTTTASSGNTVIRVAVRATFRLTHDLPATSEAVATLKTELAAVLADSLGVPRARIRINELRAGFTDLAAQSSGAGSTSSVMALTQEAAADEVDVRVLSLLNFNVTTPDGATLDLEDATTSLTFDVDAVTVALASGDLTRLGVAYYIEAEDAWVALPCSVEGVGITCELATYPVDLILYVIEQTSAPLVPSPAPTGIGIVTGGDRTGPFALLAGAVLGIAVLGGLGRRFSRRRA